MKRVFRPFWLMIFLLNICLIGHSQGLREWISLDSSAIGTPPTEEVLISDKSVHIVKFTIHGFYDETINKVGKVFHKLSLPNYSSYTSEIGKPALPTISQLIGIPQGNSCTTSIMVSDSVTMSTDTLFPHQKPTLETEEPNFSFDESSYRKEEYKIPIILKGDVNRWKCTNNIRCDVVPFHYFPRKGKLTIRKEMILILKFDTVDTNNTLNKLSVSDIKIFDNKLNLDSLTDFDGDDQSYDYLVIVGDTSKMLNSLSLRRFLKWKAYKGYKTKVVSTYVTGNTCQSIKEYIAMEYAKGLRYVLFVGNDDRIPMYYWQNRQKSDYWYGCMDGNDDYQADIAIGRFATNDSSELNNIIDKTIAYESQENKYGSNVLLVAHKQNAPYKYQGCLETIRTASYLTPMTFLKAYGADSSVGGTEATNDSVISKINIGLNIVNYRGHGSWNSWATGWSYDNKEFTSNEVAELNNICYPIVFCIACQTSDIRGHQCLMQHFMTSKYGATAYLGATENSYTEANHVFDQLLFDQILNKGIYNLGDVNIQSHILNMAKSNLYYAKENAFCYLCGGDPTLEILTQPTKIFSDLSISFDDYKIKINVPDLNEYSVSVVVNDKNLYTKHTSESSMILESLPTEATIVLNKHNYIPYAFTYKGNDVVYVQNTIVNNNVKYCGKTIETGYNVTSSKDFGTVTIKNGGSLILNGTESVVIKNGFECEKGGCLTTQ